MEIGGLTDFGKEHLGFPLDIMICRKRNNFVYAISVY